MFTAECIVSIDATRRSHLSNTLGNTRSLRGFQVGAKDTELLAEQLGGTIEPSDLMSLPKFTAYARLLIDGLPSRPFSMQTLVPRKAPDAGRIDVIRKTSRHRYGRRVA
ncbi:hypothetical protein H6770_01045 [Candidatus Peribacteria bacterium]|nr:hypothetical protein [Candidatus Peribacteria bacterium]